MFLSEVRVTVVACEVPKTSALNPTSIATAYFKDAYRAPLQNAKASLPDIFFAIFGHHPWWIKAPLLVRNAAAKVFGLETPSAHLILNPVKSDQYRVGDTIGPWPIFHLSPTELIAGRNNKHLDFRLSILKPEPQAPGAVVVSTICNTHNMYGKAYLRVIIPFHVWGVQWLIANAVRHGRI
jgi:hypothetical protein